MDNKISDSRFYMWRTLFAVVHADSVVTDEEIGFMAHVLDDIDFSDEQTVILKDDIATAKNAEVLFDLVTEQQDRSEFFDLARDLVWVDGDFGTEEQSVMIKLQQAHIKKTDVDSLVGEVSLEFEEEDKSSVVQEVPLQKVGLSKILSLFKK